MLKCSLDSLDSLDFHLISSFLFISIYPLTSSKVTYDWMGDPVARIAEPLMNHLHSGLLDFSQNLKRSLATLRDEGPSTPAMQSRRKKRRDFLNRIKEVAGVEAQILLLRIVVERDGYRGKVEGGDGVGATSPGMHQITVRYNMLCGSCINLPTPPTHCPIRT